MIKRTKSPLPPFSKGAIDTPPPMLGTWRAVYALLLGELAGLILLFYALTRWAS
jgi:hypothetical protein